MLGFRPERFTSVVERIKGEHLTPLEFVTAYIDNVSGGNPKHILKELEGSVPESIAYSFKCSQMERLLFLANNDIPLSLRQKILRILSIRMRRRYFDIAWLLIQNNPENITLARFLFASASYIKRRYPDYYASSVHSTVTSYTEDLPSQIHKIIKNRKAALSDFLISESIIPDSLLAANLFLFYFSTCTSKEYIGNHNHLVTLVKNPHRKPQVDDVIIRYLKQISILEYARDVNDAIEAAYGRPSDKGAFWDKAGENLSRKFSQWRMIVSAEVYFSGEHRRKHLVFRNFADHLADLQVNEEEGLLIADFGRFHIVDLRSEESSLYLMKNTVFQIHNENYELLKEDLIKKAEIRKMKQNDGCISPTDADVPAPDAAPTDTDAPAPDAAPTDADAPAPDAAPYTANAESQDTHTIGVTDAVDVTHAAYADSDVTLANVDFFEDAGVDTENGMDTDPYSDLQSGGESDYRPDPESGLSNYDVGEVDADYSEYYGDRTLDDSPVKAWHDAFENAVSAHDAVIYGISGDIYSFDMKDAGILFTMEIISKEVGADRKRI